MRDPCLKSAIALVDQVCTMPTGDAMRHLFDCYRTSSRDSQDAIVLALTAALLTRPPHQPLNVDADPRRAALEAAVARLHGKPQPE